MKLTHRIVQAAALIALGAVSAFSQTPTSGALLTISGTAGSTAVNINIYDSQIHSGLVQSVPVGVGSSCLSIEQIPTDAYVLQGGSPTGCDAGDAFEITEPNNTNSGHQTPGTANISGFHIETHYTCGGACSGNISVTGPVCNTSGTICANPDTGFLTVTNNTGSPFTGTITLKGTSPIAGGSFCPGSVGGVGPGVAFDSATNLAAGESVTLALGTQGSKESPGNSDSSNCGGFNQGQTQTLVAGQTSIFPFGSDDYRTTPLNSNTGENLTITPIPVPSGYTQVGTVTQSSLFFHPGANFPGKECVAYKDFSAPGNPVCVEIQRDCTVNCGGYLYTAQLDFNIDGSSLPNGIGGPSFMGKHGVNCPTNLFDVNIFFSYTGANIDPVKGSGGGGGSCFVAAFDPNAAAIPTGTTFSSFVGFQTPVSDTDLNIIKAGSAVPLTWQQFISPGVPLINLSLCPLGPSSGNPAVCATSGVSAPWVFLGTIQTNCMNDSSPNTDPTSAAGNSGLQNFGNGTYQYNWKTVKGSTGCVDVVLIYDTGLTLFPAQFKYK